MYRFASQRRIATAGFALDTLTKFSKYEWTPHRTQNLTSRYITGIVEDVSSDMPGIPFSIQSSGIGGTEGTYTVSLGRSDEFGSGATEYTFFAGDRNSVNKLDKAVFNHFIPNEMRFASQRRIATAGFALDTLTKFSKYEWTPHRTQNLTSRYITGIVEDVSSDMPGIPFSIQSSGIGGTEGTYTVSLGRSDEFGSGATEYTFFAGDRNSVNKLDKAVFNHFIPNEMRFASQRRRRFF